MTERERFISTLKREKIGGRVPHFELVFFLTMEVLRKVHPSHRFYEQWNQMSDIEQKLQIDDMATCYIDIAEKYEHSAIFVHPNPGDLENTLRLLEAIRERTGDKYFLMMHGDPTHGIPNGDTMEAFSVMMYDEPETLHEQSKRRVEKCAEAAQWLNSRGHLLDGYALCADYCFNVNPFFSPGQFAELIAPYLKEITSIYHELGYYVIKHTDGNIMPIVDQLVDCGPDALHSLDPQGGVDLGYIQRTYGDRVALIGNVNCAMLQTGSDEECAADVRRALKDGMAGGGGYVFATSNCVYTGMPLSRYEMMVDIWKREGIYK
jgi:uroporphyrinogen decarboxylase